jgi:hypothetical protein
VWSPYELGDIKTLEDVQRSFTRTVCLRCRIPFPNGYADRLTALNLLSLECRRTIADLVIVFKMLKGLVFVESLPFTLSETSTRGHRFKLFHRQARTTAHLNSFSLRVVSPWNALPADIVNCSTVALFRSKLQYHLTTTLNS